MIENSKIGSPGKMYISMKKRGKIMRIPIWLTNSVKIILAKSRRSKGNISTGKKKKKLEEYLARN